MMLLLSCMPYIGTKMSIEGRNKLSLSKKGKPLTLEHRLALSNAKKGRRFEHLYTPQVRKKISQAMKGNNNSGFGSKSHQWKGDEASYFAIHAWIGREKGKANKCENPDCVSSHTLKLALFLVKNYLPPKPRI